MNTRRWMAVGIAGLALAVVAGGVAVAGDGPGRKARDKQKYEQLFLDRLASKLGISGDKLTSAGRAAAGDVIAQALKDGVITEAQAAEMRERVAEMKGLGFGLGRFWKGGHRGGHAQMGRVHRAVIDAIAGALGMTPEQLRAAKRDGKTLEDLATAKGLTMAKLGDIAVAAAKPLLDEMVKDGTLTRERADRMLAKIRARGARFGHEMKRAA